jgi:hypothetical protein
VGSFKVGVLEREKLGMSVPSPIRILLLKKIDTLKKD